jgi:adenosine kinase
MTRGRRGARVEVAGQEPIDVSIAQEMAKLDPTGVGDAFRAGFIAGLSWGVSLERCAQIGSMLSAYVIAVVGTQEYRFNGSFQRRFADAYGDDAAADIAPHLTGLRL